jgi:lipid-A-disaccharide synthase
MRYYIIAGERSGDLHGSNLVKSLKARDPQAEFRGFGGEYMQEAGVELFVHYGEMAFMGLVEFLGNIRKSLRYLKRVREDILAYKPDVLILIDYGGFNRQMATFGKAHGLNVFYYIPPKVWAWRQKRALQLKATVTRMFVILPFEKDFFKKFNWEVDYVGNPVLDAIKAHVPDQEFARKAAPTGKPRVALLPGSRKQELQGIVPLMAAVVRRFPAYQFYVATINNLDPSLYADLKDLPNVTFVYEHTYDLLLNAEAAIVTSGTATLETALFKVPQVVVYRTSNVSYWLAKSLIRVPFISLVNLIAGYEVVKEMIQDQANTDTVSAELDRMLNNQAHRSTMLKGYDEIYSILDTGSASENTARLMIDYLRK